MAGGGLEGFEAIRNRNLYFEKQQRFKATKLPTITQ